MLNKILSCGETGAARGALDAAAGLDIGRGGWIVLGRKTETGPLPDAYPLREMSGTDMSEADRKNIIDSDGTLVLTHGPLSPRGARIVEMAEAAHRPHLVFDLKVLSAFEAAQRLNTWVTRRKIAVLHVTGSRASRDPRLYQATRDILEAFWYLHLAAQAAETAAPVPDRIEPDVAAAPPRSVSQAVARLVEQMPLRDRVTIANMSAGELSALDASPLGEFIRTRFDLESGNRALGDSCRWISSQLGIDPENPSAVIVRKLWESLRKTHALRIVP